MACNHTIAEQDAVRIGGLCPLCLKAEAERLKKALEIATDYVRSEYSSRRTHNGKLYDIEQALKDEVKDGR